MQIEIELRDDSLPITKSLTGILKDSNVDIADYKTHLEEKYLAVLANNLPEFPAFNNHDPLKLQNELRNEWD